MDLLLVMLVAGGGAWFWRDSMRATELGRDHALRACRRLNVQLLDGTVALRKLRLGRDENGRLRLRRFFGFEFTVTGADRRAGVVVMLGPRLEYLHLDLPDEPVISMGEEA